MPPCQNPLSLSPEGPQSPFSTQAGIPGKPLFICLRCFFQAMTGKPWPEAVIISCASRLFNSLNLWFIV